MQRTNPITNAAQASEETSQYGYLSKGRVTSAPINQSDGLHHVIVQESAAPTDEPLPVLPSVHGDYYVPPKGAPVIVAPIGKNDYAVIGGAVPDISRPSTEPGERVLSHPLSKASVRFNQDGSLDVAADGKLGLNGSGSTVTFHTDGTLDIDAGDDLQINASNSKIHINSDGSIDVQASDKLNVTGSGSSFTFYTSGQVDVSAGDDLHVNGAGSSVDLNSDGSVDIDASGNVRINNGSVGVITDVTGVDVDGDGNLEDIDIQRDSSILI